MFVPQVDSSLLLSPYVRYGSVPAPGTLYVTSGYWATDNSLSDHSASASTRRQLTPRVSVDSTSGQATVSTTPSAQTAARRKAAGAAGSGDWQVGDAWCQVLKSTDGGKTWAMVYNDTTSGL